METIAVISDVHGNLEALEAVLAAIDALDVAAIYSLGDVVGYGPDPEACLALINQRCRVRLMGNHEFGVLRPESPETDFNPRARRAVDWTRERLRQAGLLESFAWQTSAHREGPWLFVHGSARNSLNEYVLEHDAQGHSYFDRILTSLERDFTDFRLCFVGHNHRPFLATREGFLHPHEGCHEFRVPEDEVLYASVGSVGQPRDGDPRACFATFDGTRLAYHRVAYPFEITAEKIRARGLPVVFAERLAVGR